MLAQRSEVQPVGNRAQIRPEARFGGRVLLHLGIAPADIDLLAVIECVFVERTQGPELAAHGPLIYFFDGYFLRLAQRLPGPCRSHPIDHGLIDFGLDCAVVGIDHRSAACTPAPAAPSSSATAEAVNGTAVETG